MRLIPLSLLGCSVLGIAVVPSNAATSSPPDPLQAVQTASSEWIKIRAATVKAETDWATNRALLESTIKALNERAAELEAKRDQLNAKSAEERDELAAMVAKNKDATGALSAAETRLKTLDQQLVALRAKLPPRLSSALEMSLRSLAEKELSVGERMQLTMTVLNRCAQFNSVVTTAEEELTLEGEPTAKSLEVIYWGLSQGYALDRATGKAWLGAPGTERWEWIARPEAAPAVTRLMEINGDKADPAFVAVPLQIRHPSPEGLNK